jgi:hypothetical protein
MLKTDGFGGFAREGGTSCITREYVYVKMYLREIGCEDYVSIRRSRKRIQRLEFFFKTVMDLQVPDKWNTS